MKEGFKQWIIAAGKRAIATFAETMIGFVAYGMAMSEIPWLQALSVSTVAAILSLLKSIAGLPELKKSDDVVSSGKIVLDEDNNMANLEFDMFPEGAEQVTLDVVKKNSDPVD